MKRVRSVALARLAPLVGFVCACGGTPSPAATTPPPVVTPPTPASFLDEADAVADASPPSAPATRPELVPLNVHRSFVRALVPDPRGRYFVVIDDDAVVSLHDAASGQTKAVVRAAIRRSNPPAVSIDTSGTRAAISVSGGDAEPSRVFAWDLASGRFAPLPHGGGSLFATPSAAISPDGARVHALRATLADEAVARVELVTHDFLTGGVVAGPTTVESPRSMHVAPSGATIAVRTIDPDVVTLYDAASLAPRGVVEGVTSDAVFHPRGGQMLVATGQSIAVRSPRDGRVLGSLGVDTQVTAIAYAADGECFAAYGEDGDVHLRRARTLEAVHRAHVEEIAGLAVLPDCAGVLVSDRTGALTRHRTGLPPAGEPLRTPAPSTSSQYGAFGGPVALVGTQSLLAIGVGEEVALVDASSGEERARTLGGSGERSVWYARFGARGERLYVSGRGYLDVWSAEGARRTACGGPSLPVVLEGGHALVSSPQGLCDPDTGTIIPGYALDTAKRAPLAIARNANELFVYDAARRARGRTLLAPGTRECPDENAPCGELAVISDDGTRVAVAARDPDRVFVFDAASGRKLAMFPLPRFPAAMHFAADGVTLTVLASDAIRALPPRGTRARVLHTFDGHASIQAGPAGVRYVVVRAQEGLAIIDLETGATVLTVPADGTVLTSDAQLDEVFVAHVWGVATAIVHAPTGRRVPLEGRRLLGIASDASRIAVCEGDALRVVRIDGQSAPPVELGACGLADEVAFRPDGQAFAVREGSHVSVRTGDGHVTTLRTTRSANASVAFASNERGELAFDDTVAPLLCLRNGGTLFDAPCTTPTAAHRTDDVLRRTFSP